MLSLMGDAMFKRINLLILSLLLVGCAARSSLKRDQAVTIILNDGTKIKAQVMDIWHDRVVFKAEDWIKAYEYGEVLNVERIKGIRIEDGTVLSVKDYDAYRKGGEIDKRKPSHSAEVSVVDAAEFESGGEGEPQYDELKKKPISDMSDNEFRFFMMMKERELETRDEIPALEKDVESERVAPSSLVEQPRPEVNLSDSPKLEVRLQEEQELEDVVSSLIDAEVASVYLSRLIRKSQMGEPLNQIELKMRELIKNHPVWREKVGDIKFIDRKSRKTLERAFLYNPDELTAKLGLVFDADSEMDYLELMGQLHRKIGDDVKMRDFRVLVDVFGESGGQAIKEILENFESWQFMLHNETLVVK